MGKGATKFDPKKFHQKLQSLANDKDSIYNVSSLFFQCKDHAQHAVKLWNDVFEKGNVEFRLALIYLANEILHNCKRKEASVYREEFKKVLNNALNLLKGSNIVDKVVRVLELWSERKVLDTTFCSSMIASITSSSGSIEDAKIDAELIKNFSPDTVITALKEFLIQETDTASKERQLRILSVDALGANAAAIRALKDRSHAEAYRTQLDESCQRLEDLVKDLEKLVDRREALLAMLEKAHMFFAAQYSDVNVVVTAYRKYGEMIAYMRRRIEERIATEDEIGSPKAEAPSPTADIADAFGAEVAVLSRREDEMDVESGGSIGEAATPSGSHHHHHHHQHDSSSQRRSVGASAGGGGGSSSSASRHQQQQHAKKRRSRHDSGGGDRSKHRKRSSRSSRSRSRSPSGSSSTAGPAGGGGGTSGGQQVPERHEMAIGSDSPPQLPAHSQRRQFQHQILQPPHHQHQHQLHRRSGTPTLDERPLVAGSAAGQLPPPQQQLQQQHHQQHLPPPQPPLQSSGIGALAPWLQPWRPQQQQQTAPATASVSAAAAGIGQLGNPLPQQQQQQPPPLHLQTRPAPPLPPPPPPFFPPFLSQQQQQQQQQLSPQPLQQQQQPPPQFQQQQLRPQMSLTSSFGAGGVGGIDQSPPPPQQQQQQPPPRFPQAPQLGVGGQFAQSPLTSATASSGGGIGGGGGSLLGSLAGLVGLAGGSLLSSASAGPIGDSDDRLLLNHHHHQQLHTGPPAASLVSSPQQQQQQQQQPQFQHHQHIQQQPPQPPSTVAGLAAAAVGHHHHQAAQHHATGGGGGVQPLMGQQARPSMFQQQQQQQPQHGTNRWRPIDGGFNQ